MRDIEDHLATAQPKCDSANAGAILLPSFPGSQALCEPWTPQVLRVLLPLRMRPESSICGKALTTNQYPHIKYAPRIPEELEPNDVCDEL